MTKRAIICARVSTDRQAAEGRSVSTQLEAMCRYAQQHGMDVTQQIIDDCSGTIPIRSRPGGAQLYRAIDQRAVDSLIFFTLDRATRDDDVIEIHTLRRDCRNAGIELHYADTGQSDLSTWGSVIDHVRAAGAAEERKKIIERNARGRRAKALAGRWVGAGPEPFGYRRIGSGRQSELEIDESEAATVRRIFTQFLGWGGQMPVSVRKLCETLTEEGVPTPARSKGCGKLNTRGWHTRTINMILKRRLYVGEMVYRDVVTPMPDLAIIDRAMFDAVQERKGLSRGRFAGNRKREYLLAGHIRCTCGRAMIGKDKHDPYRYYWCAGRSLPRHLRDCTERMVRGPDMDALAWDWLCRQLNDDMLSAALDRLAQRQAKDLEPARARLVRLEADCERLQRRIDVWTAQYPDATDAELASLKGQVRTTSAELAHKRDERERLQGEIEQGDVSQQQRREIIHSAATIRERMHNASYDKRRYFLHRLDLQVKMRRDETGQLWADLWCGVREEAESVAVYHHCPSNLSSGHTRAML
jgi:site-specific DNA recombinase